MTLTRCPACGAALDSGEMPDLVCALYLRCIRLTKSVPALASLADEIVERFPEDEATPRLAFMIAAKAARLSLSAAP